MKLRLVAGLLLCLWATVAGAFWQSRDSNYDIAANAPAAYTGPGDIVASATAWWGLRAYSAAKRGTKSINVCNVSDVACADMSTDAVTGALVVTTIGGSSCSVITCTVKTVYDQAGTNCGGSACDLTNTTIATRPVLIVSCQNSLPCLDFSGGSTIKLANATGFGAISQPFTLSMTFDRTLNNNAYQNYLVSSSTSVGLYGNNVANGVLQYVGTNLPVTTASDAAFHAGQFIYNNASSFGYVDGSNTAQNLGAATGWPIGAITFGFDGTRDTVSMKMLEIGFWSSGFSAGNASSVNSNQHTFWGF